MAGCLDHRALENVAGWRPGKWSRGADSSSDVIEARPTYNIQVTNGYLGGTKMKAVFEEFPKIPIAPPRFVVYIDGYNLYGAINHAEPEYLFRLGWCNLQRLGEVLVERSFSFQAQQPTVTVKYFTVKVDEHTPHPHKGEIRRQKMWLDAQEKEAPKVEKRLGVWSPVGGRTEKMTDVNIALEIAKDIINLRPTGIVLVSGDMDFQPVVQHAATADVPIVVFFPDDHKTYNLTPGADGSRVRFAHLTQDLLKDCRLKSDFLPYLRLKVEADQAFQRCLEYEERQARSARH